MAKNEMQQLWEEINLIVASMEKDAIKTDGGNIRSGVVLRKGLRLLKERAANMLRESIERKEQFAENKRVRLKARRDRDAARQTKKSIN